jgi:hypothetical protein
MLYAESPKLYSSHMHEQAKKYELNNYDSIYMKGKNRETYYI